MILFFFLRPLPVGQEEMIGFGFWLVVRTVA
jgi:hypothetical protein